MTPSSGAIENIAIAAAFIGFGVLLWRAGARSEPGRPLSKDFTPVPQERAEEMFPGFVVGANDFAINGNVTYRINDDGEKYNLQNWHFDDICGEFRHIKRLEYGKIIFNSDDIYSSRLVKIQSNRQHNMLIAILYLGSSALLYGMAAWGNVLLPRSVAIYSNIFWWSLIIMLLLALVTGWKDVTPGPQPLRRRVQTPFGGEGQQPVPAYHDDNLK